MKKRDYLLIAAMVIVAIAATLFVGCKKEKSEVQTKCEKSEAQNLVDHINAFQMLCESVGSGLRTEDVMSVEEMRQTLDLTVNYEHSEHMTYSENIILDTLYLNMPLVNEEGNVSKMDVVSTYNSFEAELQEHMERVNDGRNIPSYFSIVMPENKEKTENYIMVVFNRGEKGEETVGDRSTYEYDGPFIEIIDDWYWGDNLGKCKWDPYNATTDASEQLSYKFRFVIQKNIRMRAI